MNYIETAIEAARIGGRTVTDSIQNFSRDQIDSKRQFDYVTEVDRKSEAAIIGFIKSSYPQHHIFAEESGGEYLDRGYVWVIDPLDGTKNYIHGLPHFAVSVALLQDGESIAGAVLDPNRNELFHAEKGSGAYLDGQPIRVSPTEDMHFSLLATGFPFRAKDLTDIYFEAFIRLFHQVSDMRRIGSAALDLSYVACGRLDGFWELTLNAWDIAAGTLILEEAGGKMTDVWGGDSYLQTGHVVATNGKIHDPVIQITSDVFRTLK